MKTMLSFFKAVLRMAKPWVAWVALMMTTNMVTPIFFIDRVEAQVVLITTMASAALMVLIFAKKGFVRLLGLGHVLWVPMIFWLLTRVGLASPVTWFEKWIVAVIVVSGLSVIIDAVDVIRYARGERAPTVPFHS
ncbi:MAG: hypothetical protein NPINA01_18680 [Nitrospinaceae bacterium]|nr:MAG: hypothetical protein NPINA01_18680 [Nitrospinaceae bacterium]